MGPPRYCATCGSTNVHPSRCRSEFEALMLPFLFRPYRCRHCSRRFYGFVLARSPKARPARLDDDLFSRSTVESIPALASASANFSSEMPADFRQPDDWDLPMPSSSSFTVGVGDCDPLSLPRPPSLMFIDLREDPKAWMRVENELPKDVRSPR